VAEAAVIAALFALYLASFGPSSPFYGPREVFAQDSAYLLDALARGVTYPWNPQNHLLHHVVVEGGYVLWQRAFGSGRASAFHYLKLFSALSGLAFLVVLGRLLSTLGLAAARRAVVLALTGIAVSVWFHFSAVETHCLAMPALATYLLCLVRLRQRTQRTAAERWMLVVSLAALGLIREDLFRFAAVSALLLLLPAVERWRRSLAVDLALVAVLVVGGSIVIARGYLHLPWSEAVTVMFDRDDRPELEDRIGRVANLNRRDLVTVGRALTLYSMVMPVEPRGAGRGFLAPPRNDLARAWRSDDEDSSTNLFDQPARNLLGSAVSLAACVAIGLLLVGAVVTSVRGAATGDPLHALLLGQAIVAWLLYTWFDPFEPFLWVLECVPLWIVMIAELMRSRRGAAWWGLGLAAAILGVHNAFAFWLPFR
jgi:hypothetical protein